MTDREDSIKSIKLDEAGTNPRQRTLSRNLGFYNALHESVKPKWERFLSSVGKF